MKSLSQFNIELQYSIYNMINIKQFSFPLINTENSFSLIYLDIYENILNI